jgi:hypothetical protein
MRGITMAKGGTGQHERRPSTGTAALRCLFGVKLGSVVQARIVQASR